MFTLECISFTDQLSVVLNSKIKILSRLIIVEARRIFIIAVVHLSSEIC